MSRVFATSTGFDITFFGRWKKSTKTSNQLEHVRKKEKTMHTKNPIQKKTYEILSQKKLPSRFFLSNFPGTDAMKAAPKLEERCRPT